MKKLISLLLMLLIIFTLCSCVNDKQIEDNTTTSTTEASTESENSKYMNSENCVINGKNGYYEIPNEFSPFECSKDDYADFDGASVKNSYFTVKWGCENIILVRGENDSEVLFDYVNTNGSYRMAYIKDSLYFIGKGKLYKLKVDESGEYENSDFSFVADFDAIPCFVEENKMYLRYGKNGEPEKYYVLDTLTGECKPTDDFNKVLDKAPSNLISKKKAEAIALDALNKGIDGTEYKLSRKDADIVETKLIYKPDSNYETIIENSPEYVYQIFLTGNYIGPAPEEYLICVNAKSGKISMINYRPMDN